MSLKQVIHFQGRMGKGGAESFMMNLYREIDRSEFQFNFLIYKDFEEIKDHHQEIEKLGGRVFVVTNPKKNLLKYIWEVSQLLKLERFDIAHNQVYFGGGINLYLAKKYGIKKRVAHSHATSDGKGKNIIMNILRKYLHFLLMTTATDFVAVSQEAGISLFWEQPFEIVHNGIDLKVYAPNSFERERLRKELGFSSEEIILGNIGRLELQKNQQFLLQIVAEMKKQSKKMKLLLLGDGSLKKELLHQIKTENLENEVIYLGERTDIPKLMNAMDVFVMTSLYEGLPMVGVEAQANQKKLVLSDTISSDTKLTPNVNFVSLEAPIQVWIDEIIKKPYSNELTEELKQFDVSYTAKQMIRIYNRV